MIELNKIYCENNLETMSRMPDNFIDLTVTSPPYDNLRNYNGYSFDFENVAKELYRVTKTGGVVVWVVGDATVNGSESGTSFRQALYFMECGFRLHDTMIWEKHTIPVNANRYEPRFEFMFVFSKGTPRTFNPIKYKKKWEDNRTKKMFQREKNGAMLIKKTQARELVTEGNIWYYPVSGGLASTDPIASEHPAIFPEQLAADHIFTWSNEGDLIYDPFTGSGTTLKMAHLQKRNWIGSEISQQYVDLANKRIAPYLAQTTLDL